MRSVGFCLALLCGGVIGAAGKTCASSPLSVRVREFQATNQPVLHALIQLGQQNQLCFGVEVFAPELLRQRAGLSVKNAAVRDILPRLLESLPNLEFVEQDGVILFRRIDAGPSWLDLRLKEFSADQGSVQSLSNLLFMTFVRETTPSVKGFAGDYRPGAGSRSGPFAEKGKTVRQLLSLLLTRGAAGCWVVNRNATKPRQSAHWILLEYAEDRESLLQIANHLLAAPASR